MQIINLYPKKEKSLWARAQACEHVQRLVLFLIFLWKKKKKKKLLPS